MGVAPYVADLSQLQPQSIPDCFVKIVRFNRRDTRGYESDKRPAIIMNEGASGIRHQARASEVTTSTSFNIVSDILSCVVNKQKDSPSGSFTLILAPGDINYHHLIHPGDHIFIWMKRNRAKDLEMGSKEYNTDLNGGLKLYGVITGVRKQFKAAPNGRKTLRYQITGKDFGYFFEQQVYYNGSIGSLLKDKALFNESVFGVNALELLTPDTLFEKFLNAFMGTGLFKSDNAKKILGRPATENKVLFLPTGVREMWGGGETLADIILKRAGIELYTEKNIVPARVNMQGVKIFHVEPGAQYQLWQVLQSFSNPTLNEMFVDLKPDHILNPKKLKPCIVLRQRPFTSSKAKKSFLGANIFSTTLVELPRIKIPESFIISEDIGRGDHERFNMIEMFGTYPGLEDIATIAAQISLGNYAVDLGSIQRYGLRTYIPRTDYHYPDKASIDDAARNHKDQKASLVPKWINLLADWWLGAHTLESGTFSLVGVEESLSLGDNIEIVRQNGVNELYHVEGYSHTYQIDENGMKTFRTNINVMRGQRVDEFPIYASGSISEEDILDIGFTDTEFESTSRPQTAVNDTDSGISAFERPGNRKKEQK